MLKTIDQNSFERTRINNIADRYTPQTQNPESCEEQVQKDYDRMGTFTECEPFSNLKTLLCEGRNYTQGENFLYHYLKLYRPHLLTEDFFRPLPMLVGDNTPLLMEMLNFAKTRALAA